LDNQFLEEEVKRIQHELQPHNAERQILVQKYRSQLTGKKVPPEVKKIIDEELVLYRNYFCHSILNPLSRHIIYFIILTHIAIFFFSCLGKATEHRPVWTRNIHNYQLFGLYDSVTMGNLHN
jgi:hypothetical protein